MKKALTLGIILLFFLSFLIPIDASFTFNKTAINSDEYPFKSPPNEIWNKTYGGTDSDSFEYVQQTNDNGYIMVGTTRSYSSSGLDIWMMKTDIDGHELWNKTYGGPYDEWSHCVRETYDGGFIITGAQEMSWAGYYNTTLIRTDSEGNTLWNKTYVRNDCKSDGCSIIELDDGYLVMSLLFYVDYPGDEGIWLVKTDFDGHVQWDNVVSEENDDAGNSMIQTKNGDFVIVGERELDQVLLIKTDSNGTVLWRKTYDGWEGKDIKECDDGGYIIAGREHVCLIRTDEDGNVLWKKEYQWVGFDTALSVDLTSDGGFILSGNVAPDSDCDMLVLKTDANGNREWETHLGGSETDTGNCVIQSNDGTYIVTGLSSRSGQCDAWLVKLAPFSNQRPVNPALEGPMNGKPFRLYSYSMSATDPEEDSLFYWFEWGDNSYTPWQGPYQSGVPCHTSKGWYEKGTYTILAKAIDVYGGDSEWVTLQVTIPYSYEPQFPFIQWLLERFPNAFPLLRYLLKY